MSDIYWKSDCGRVTLYHGDSFDVLPLLPKDVVGTVITDPPYGEETHSKARSVTVTRGVFLGGRKHVDFKSMTVEQVRDRLALAAQRVTRWLVATCEFRHANALEQNPPDGWKFVRLGVWTKSRYAPQISGDRPAQGWESILLMHRPGRTKWNGGGASAVWHHGTVIRGAYPTEKPLPLVREFVELFSDPGELILDPFCGSGTSLVAALERGRRAIGIDISEKALAIAQDKCERVLNQGSLF